ELRAVLREAELRRRRSVDAAVVRGPDVRAEPAGPHADGQQLERRLRDHRRLSAALWAVPRAKARRDGPVTRSSGPAELLHRPARVPDLRHVLDPSVSEV